MPPKDFIEARELGKDHAIVDGQPYLPKVVVAPKGPPQHVAAAAVVVLGLQTKNGSSLDEFLTVSPVLGGLSNTLYRVEGLQTLDSSSVVDSILVRIFGAEGMIDRDIETSTFAALAKEGHVPPYYGRFGNGRLEGWMTGMRPLDVPELSRDAIIQAVARKVAVLHTKFQIPNSLKKYYTEPNMWRQLEEWLQQALKNKYQTVHDEERAASLQLATTVADEFAWIRCQVLPANALVVYCHNDLLAANIMYNETTHDLQLIDFEYGGVNFRSFDVANHWNEYASGPPHETVPHYDWLPNEEQQNLFCRTYLQAAASDNETITDGQVQALRSEVQAFLLPNHLYWGLWAINQAATEGCDKYDYMRYGIERFRQYYKCKQEWLSSSSN